MRTRLQETRLFSSLPIETIDWLAERTIKKSYKKGEYLFHEGEESRALYVINDGSVKVVKEFASGKNAILGIFGPGTTVAEVAVVDGKPYPASAVAHMDTETGLISATVFMELLRKAPEESAIQMIHGLGARLRDMTETLGVLAVETVNKRLARFLIKLAGTIGEETDDGLLLTLPMTRRDIAEIIGATFEVVERSLKKFRDEKIIAVNGKKIIILDKTRLKQTYSN